MYLKGSYIHNLTLSNTRKFSKRNKARNLLTMNEFFTISRNVTPLKFALHEKMPHISSVGLLKMDKLPKFIEMKELTFLYDSELEIQPLQ